MSVEMSRVKKCIELCVMAENDPEMVNAIFSTGERIIVAFLLNRMDWLPSHANHPLDALEQLGDQWQVAIRLAHHFRRIAPATGNLSKTIQEQQA